MHDARPLPWHESWPLKGRSMFRRGHESRGGHEMTSRFSKTMIVLTTPLLIATLGGCVWRTKEIKEVDRDKGSTVVTAPPSGPVVMSQGATPTAAPPPTVIGPDRSRHVPGRTLAALWRRSCRAVLLGLDSEQPDAAESACSAFGRLASHSLRRRGRRASPPTPRPAGPSPATGCGANIHCLAAPRPAGPQPRDGLRRAHP